MAEADPDVNADALSYWTFLNDLAAAGFPGLRLSDRPPSVSRDVWFVCGRLQLDGKVLHLPWQIPDWPDLRREDNLRRAWQELLRRLPQGGAGGTKWQDEWANGVWDIFQIAVGLADREVPTERWRQWWGEKPGEPEEEGGRPSGSVEWKAWEVVAAVHAAPEYGLGASAAFSALAADSRLDRNALIRLRRVLLSKALSRALGRPAGVEEVAQLEKHLREAAHEHPWYQLVDRATLPSVLERLALFTQPVRLPSWVMGGGAAEPYRETAFRTVKEAHLVSRRRHELLARAPAQFVDELRRLASSVSDSVSLAELVSRVVSDAAEGGGGEPGDTASLAPVALPARYRLGPRTLVRKFALMPDPAPSGWEGARELAKRLEADAHVDAESQIYWVYQAEGWQGLELTVPDGEALWSWPSPAWPGLIDHELCWDAWNEAPETDDLDLLARTMVSTAYEVGQSRTLPLEPAPWPTVLDRVFRNSDRNYRGWRWEAFDAWRDRLVLLAAPWAQLPHATARLIVDAWLAAPCRPGLSPEDRWSRVLLSEEDRRMLVRQLQLHPDHPFCLAAGPHFPPPTT